MGFFAQIKSCYIKKPVKITVNELIMTLVKASVREAVASKKKKG